MSQNQQVSQRVFHSAFQNLFRIFEDSRFGDSDKRGYLSKPEVRRFLRESESVASHFLERVLSLQRVQDNLFQIYIDDLFNLCYIFYKGPQDPLFSLAKEIYLEIISYKSTSGHSDELEVYLGPQKLLISREDLRIFKDFAIFLGKDTKSEVHKHCDSFFELFYQLMTDLLCQFITKRVYKNRFVLSKEELSELPESFRTNSISDLVKVP